MHKEAHDKYGANVQLNIHWEFDETTEDFTDNTRQYFNLSMMTDKFKDEFIANSDWLRLSFHANGVQITDIKDISCRMLWRKTNVYKTPLFPNKRGVFIYSI